MRSLSLVLVGMAAANWLAGQAVAEDGWQPLFNGRDLAGWVQHGGKATYRVDGDSIVGTTAPKTANSFLCTEREYGDFELRLEFKVDPKMNSGIQFRSTWSEKESVYQRDGKEYKVRPGVVHGYQCEIDPSDRKWTAGVYEESRRGWLFNLKDKPAAGNAFRQNEWNRIRIRAVGDHIQTWINGVSAADMHDDMTLKGLIALQVHGVGDRAEPMEIRWRKIEIKELDGSKKN